MQTGGFSEETKKLKEFLMLLDTEQDTSPILKDIELFFFEPQNRPLIKLDDISSRQ